jgi:hypothetical protein
VAGGGTREEAGLGLAAAAAVAVVVWADEYVEEGQPVEQVPVDGLHDLERLRPTGHVGLVGDADEQEAEIVEHSQGLLHPGQDLDGLEGRGRVRHAVPDERPGQDTVPVQEHGAAAHRTDSHFIGFACNAGWDTTRCQTTAWNASA